MRDRLPKQIVGVVLPSGYKNAFDFSRDTGMATFNVLDLVEKAHDAIGDAAQFIDAVRQDALNEGWWTDWDQAMRDKITAALERIDALEKELSR